MGLDLEPRDETHGWPRLQRSTHSSEACLTNRLATVLHVRLQALTIALQEKSRWRVGRGVTRMGGSAGGAPRSSQLRREALAVGLPRQRKGRSSSLWLCSAQQAEHRRQVLLFCHCVLTVVGEGPGCVHPQELRRQLSLCSSSLQVPLRVKTGVTVSALCPLDMATCISP